MSQKAIYPGTFDPITKGHIDLVERACKLFDKVVLAIAASEAKSPLFTLEERIDISKRIFKGNDQVEIIGFSGLLVDLATRKCISDTSNRVQLCQLKLGERNL